MSFNKATVLITGASSGIGKAFAKNLANKGANLIITSRTENELIKLAEELESGNPGIWVKVIPVDLSQVDGAKKLFSNILDRGLCVDFLINNAGFGKSSEFTDESFETYHRMLLLNINALVELTYYLIPEMIKKNKGGIINVSSTAAFQPIPCQAVYGASKSFVLNFTEALSEELLDTKIRIMALCPDNTQTNLKKIANANTSGITPPSASEVVSIALDAYANNRLYSIPGYTDFLKSLMSRFIENKSIPLEHGLV